MPLTVRFQADFKDGRRVLTPQQEFGPAAALDPERTRAIMRLTGAATGAGPVVIGQVGPRDLVVQSVVEKKALIGAPGARNRCRPSRLTPRAR